MFQSALKCRLLSPPFGLFFYLNTVVSPAPYPGFRGCLVTSSNKAFRIDFLALTGLDSSTCFINETVCRRANVDQSCLG